MPTPQSRIKAFVEEELLPHVNEHNEEVRWLRGCTLEPSDVAKMLYRAIKLGLELGREAGDNTLFPIKHDGERCYTNENGTCYCFERNEAMNDALTAKNQAITDLIKSVG